MTESMCDIQVKGGVMVNSKELKKADVFIKDGIVDSIEKPDSGKTAATVVDASGKFVLPGIVECHLHPVYADRFDTLSKAAVLGGITTLIPYIGATKAWGVEGNLWDAVNFFIDEGVKDSIIDFSLHCSLMGTDIPDLDKLIPKICDRGVRSFKGFMAYRKRGMLLSDIDLLRILKALKENSALFAVHAENGDACDFLEDQFIAEGKTGPGYFAPSRPPITEADAVFRILSLANVVDAPMYLVHMSTGISIEVIEMFRKYSQAPIFAETCTHYLSLTNEKMLEMGSLAKASPPLREQAEVDAMWQAIKDGKIDAIGADFAGNTSAKKEPHFGNVFSAPSGIPGQETMFTVTYDEGYNRRGLSLCKLVELCAEKPAEIFGLFPRKGILKKGADADVLIFDPTKEHTVRAADLVTNCDYTMYEGRKILGTPELVMQRGEILLEDGKIKGTKGRAQFLEAKKLDW